MYPILKYLQIEVREYCNDYLTLDPIQKSFSEAGFKTVENHNTFSRRGLVEEYYSSANWQNKEVIYKFYQAIRNILKNTHSSHTDCRKYLIDNCQELGFNINNFEDFYLNSDLFSYQFPLGLPFGMVKPSVAIKAQKGSQISKFEWQDKNGILKNNIYPNLTYRKLAENFSCTPETDVHLRNALRDMNHTDCEKKLFMEYAITFQMKTQDIPVLIPQAWIQWHSRIKSKLSLRTSLQADDLYRVDFVAFWDNERYAIQIDDISHYATKSKTGAWLANEKIYSKSLKNDRKLINEGWKVLKISNWEIRDDESFKKVLQDIKSFFGF